MSQTDPRAVAKELLDALPVIFSCSQYGSVQLCKEAEEECIDTILHALADAERRGMERAAKVADDFDHLTCAEMKEKYGLVLDVRRLDIGENVARCIRAQAQADKEE